MDSTTASRGTSFSKDLEGNSEVRTQSEMERRAWKNIWSLEIPNKYKHLVWRACRNSLPTKQNMVRRTIIQQSSCDHCSLQAEDTLHALLSCTGLDEAWNGDDGVFGLQCNLMTLWRCVAGL